MMPSVGRRLFFVATCVFQVAQAIPPVPSALPEGKVTPEFANVLSHIFPGIGAPDATADYFPDQQQLYTGGWGTGLCDEQCTCGVPNRSTRIVGGKPTLINEFPWVAGLSRRGKIICGGTIITNLHVLTAAHCVQGNPFLVRATTTIVLAEHDVSLTYESPMVIRRISSVVRHPDFRPVRGTFDGDIALIRMLHSVEFATQLAPACLPSPGMDFAGHKGIIAGWGRTSEKGKPSHELRATVVPIFNDDFCKTHTFYEADKLTEHMMCAGRLEGGVDSCQGDSGGPLLVTDAFNRMVSAGIVSWGEGCARPRRPGIYTRVNHYLTWIQYHTKDACFCA